jgi:hypothetical protein
MARRIGLAGLSFTDHMAVSAVPEGMRLAAQSGVRFFTGVELSTIRDGSEYHLLLYGFRHDEGTLRDFLSHYCDAIWGRLPKAVAIFARMGFTLREEDIQGWGRSVPTGVTLLDALLLRNRGDARLREYVCGSKASSPYLSFYQDYALGDIGDAVSEALPGLMETLALFRGLGVTVLAHPGGVSEAFLGELKAQGLDGIEAYSTHHDGGTSKRLVRAARDLGLLVSAGSDFHGERIKPGIRIGDCTGAPDDALIDALGERCPY